MNHAPPDQAAKIPHRIAALDLIRAAAIFLVMGRHLFPCPPDAGPPFLNRLTVVWNRGGWTGVDLFFVLSGFLVSGLLFKEYRGRNALSVGRFFIRRGFRIYPPFYVMLVFTVLFNFATGHIVRFHEVLHEAFFVQNYLGGYWGHTWSLAIEEHFYLGLPLVLLIFIRRKPRAEDPFRHLSLWVAAVGVLCLVARIHAAAGEPLTKPFVFATHLRIDSLLFGVWIAYLHHYHAAVLEPFIRRWRYALFAAGIACFVPAFVIELEYSTFMSTWGFTLVYLGSGMVLLAVLGSGEWRAQNLPVRALATVGKYSYSIYLWHMFAHQLAMELSIGLAKGEDASWMVYFLFYAAGTILIGTFMARKVEKPSLSIRDRLFPQLSGGPV